MQPSPHSSLLLSLPRRWRLLARALRPPRGKLRKLDQPVAVLVKRGDGGGGVRLGQVDAELGGGGAHLGGVEAAVVVEVCFFVAIGRGRERADDAQGLRAEGRLHACEKV